MKGKILGAGIISGDDGNRYYYEDGEIKNLKDGTKLDGCEVDFDIREGKAVEIFITKSSFDSAALKGQFLSEDVSGIRFKFLLALGLEFAAALIGIIPFIGWFLGGILGICGLISFVLALLALNKQAQSKTLVRNLILAIAISFVSSAIGLSFSATLIFALIGGGFYGASVIGYIGLAIFILGNFAAFYFAILFNRELAYVTKQKFILWGAYLYIVGAVTSLIFIGFIIAFAAYVLQLIGYFKISEIQKRQDGDVLPWF